MKPVLSIVIANYNYGRFLEEAILSVVRQDGFAFCELIVVDGGSTDESVEIIRRHQKSIAWWCSERDGGQSAAFNKGFEHARGKYLTWLNADDQLVCDSLSIVVSQLKKHSDCEWFTANFYRYIHDTGKVLEVGWGPHCYPKWMQRKSSPIVAFGPSTIFSKEIWVRYGMFDESLHYVMDTEMWSRFIVNGVKQRRINCFVWAFRMHEDSKTAEFGAHEVSAETRRQIENERRVYFLKNGYAVSRTMEWVLRFSRIVDGSYFVGLVLTYRMRYHER